MNFPLQLHTIRIQEKSIDLFVPEAANVQQAYNSGDIAFPYWSQIWPSSLALSEFIIENQHLVQNKNVLELGAGLGLPSLVASRYASSVVCSDKDSNAVEIMSKSAIQNGIENLKASVIDWENLPGDSTTDVLLLSDINYEPVAFEKLKEILLHFLKRETTILLSTPQRLLAKPFIELFLQYCKKQEELMVMHNNKKVPITVLVLGT